MQGRPGSCRWRYSRRAWRRMSSHTALSFVSACAVNEDDAEEPLRLLVEVQQKGLVQQVITYCSLIKARAEGYNAEKALQTLVEVQRKGLIAGCYHTQSSQSSVPGCLLRSGVGGSFGVCGSFESIVNRSLEKVALPYGRRNLTFWLAV